MSVQTLPAHIETDIDILDAIGKALFLRLMLSLVLGIGIVTVLVSNLVAYAVLINNPLTTSLTLSELVKWICL